MTLSNVDQNFPEGIIAATWFTPMPPGPCIGAVAKIGESGLEYCCYIGTFPRYSNYMPTDCLDIASCGAKLTEAVAKALMPELEHLTDLPYRSE